MRADVEAILGSRLEPKEWAMLEVVYAEDLAAGAIEATELADRMRQARQRAREAPRRQPAMAMLDMSAALRPDHDALGLRTRAVSILVAQEARADPDVKSFRADVLRGRLVRWPDLSDWLKARAQRDGAGERVGLLTYFTPDEGWARRIPAVTGGVLDRLRTIAESLSKRYGVSDAQAVVFVLTDLTPVIEPLTWSVNVNLSLPGASRVVITVDPALPPIFVERAYRKARNRLLPKGRFREMDDMRVVLAAWAATRPADEAPAQRMRAWNQTMAKRKPDWRYSRLEYFTRDIQVSQRRLLHPNYHTEDLSALSGGIEDLEEGS